MKPPCRIRPNEGVLELFFK